MANTVERTSRHEHTSRLELARLRIFQRADRDYPLGHRRRHREGIPLLELKFQAASRRVDRPGGRGHLRLVHG